MKHFYETTDLGDADLREVLDRAHALKESRRPSLELAGRSMSLLFFNPSLRTRVSFMRALQDLGGLAIPLDAGKDNWKITFGDGLVMDQDGVEHIREAMGVLSRYCDFIGIRSFGEMKDFSTDREDRLIREAMRHAKVPVVNLESANAHPCQALADLATIEQLGREKPRVVLTWVPHPKALPLAVPQSFLLATTRMGWDVTVAHPDGFSLDPKVVAQAKEHTARAQGTLRFTDRKDDAFDRADVIYAKSWTSIPLYGNASEQSKLKAALGAWTVRAEDMRRTNDAAFMHCLPIRRNVEATDAVLDGPSSRILDEAENRLHAQKAILLHLFEKGRHP